MQAGLSDDVDLDGRVATGVVDLAGVNLGDGHICVVLEVCKILEKMSV